jgi:ABC-type oligopeptide transport system substrate-binding subunit
MKKVLFSTSGLMLAVLLSFTACREGGNTQQQNTPENTQEVQEAARLDSLANDLDATTEEIEQQTEELKNALDSL